MDLLLTLQSKQSSKASNIAHAAQTTFATRRLQSAFGDKYSKYWTNRKDNELRENVDEESRSTISSIQQLVHQNLLERANNVFGTSLSSHSSSSNASFSNASSSNTSSSNTSSSNTSSSNTSSSDVAFSDNTSYDANGLRKVLSQSMELASDCLARLGVIDLASNSAKDILKACTTEDYYRRIINATNPKEPEISNDAKVLITAIKELRVLSCKSLRNTLYQNGYKLNHNPINDSDIGLVENLVKHFLDLIEFPKNPLSNTILGLFLANNDIVELGWLEREYYSTGKTKWDGVLFNTNDHTISPGFVEFSGGVKDNTTMTKECRDVFKLYTKMIELIRSYPDTAKKHVFCIRFYENTMFFEELTVYEETLFRIEHAAVIAPRTIRELIKFTDNIPKLISWKNAVVAQVEHL
ncbi:hypothetical protein V8B55DRAFT_1595710 [Mucor lusitanicus]